MPSEFVVNSGVSYQTPKSDNITAAVDHLRSQYDSLVKQAAAVKAMIDNIESLRKESGDKLLPPVRPEEYRGMRAVDALESYLRVRRGLRISLAQAVEDLLAAGVDPGKPRGKKNDPAGLILHTIKISLPNKRDLFSWSPEKVKGVRAEEIQVWLADSADQPKRRKRG